MSTSCAPGCGSGRSVCRRPSKLVLPFAISYILIYAVSTRTFYCRAFPACVNITHDALTAAGAAGCDGRARRRTQTQSLTRAACLGLLLGRRETGAHGSIGRCGRDPNRFREPADARAGGATGGADPEGAARYLR